MYSCIYLNRDCVRKCSYCAERDAPLKGKQLKVEEWKYAIRILDRFCDFHLFLGNEFFLLDDPVGFVEFMQSRSDYAIYSTFPWRLFRSYRWKLKGKLYNISAGIDCLVGDPILVEKTIEGLAGLTWFKRHGIPDSQGTITLHAKNLNQVETLIELLTREGIWCGLNVIHWNLDGGYDFFPPVDRRYQLVKGRELVELIDRLVNRIVKGELMVQNPPEYLYGVLKYGVTLNWHCTLPLLISVDADGSLRCCGYRKGERLPNFTVFDLENELSIDDWKTLWWEDSRECPGCYWSYMWMIEYFERTDKDFGKEVFQKHASRFYHGHHMG